MSWFKIYNKVTNLWRQPAPKNAATVDKYLPYNSPCGAYDSFPLVWDKAIQESPSASSCLSTIQDFIEGFGFSDTNLEKFVVNPKGETFWQVHHQTVKSFSEFEGVYWLLRFNALQNTTEWEVLPFENCRLGVPDDKGYISKIYYNPFFGTVDYKSSSKSQTVVYDVYNPEAIKKQLLEQKDKFKGQVLFIGTTTARSRYYPLPQPYSVIDWMSIEAGIADYHQGKIDDGFLQQYILVMKGNPNEPSKNPDYQNVNGDEPATVEQVFNDQISKNFMGRGNHQVLMVQWVDKNAGEEEPSVVTIPTSATSDLFVTLDNQAIKKVTVGWNVPAILANIHEGVSLGGDGNMVRVAVKLMQQRVIKKQRTLTDAYEMVLKNWVKPYTQQIAIVPYNPFPELEKIDQNIWDALTPEERRQWINDNTEIELLETEVEAPNQAQARIVNTVPVSFPERVRENARRAIEYQDKMGLKCSTGGGRQVSEAIINNSNMGARQLRRIYNYLKKRPQFANSPYNEGCEAISYQAWGGKEMFDFLDVELKRLEAWLN